MKVYVNEEDYVAGFFDALSETLSNVFDPLTAEIYLSELRDALFEMDDEFPEADPCIYYSLTDLVRESFRSGWLYLRAYRVLNLLNRKFFPLGYRADMSITIQGFGGHRVDFVATHIKDWV